MDSPKPPPVQGYPKLASYMACYPDNAILRQFSGLGMRNLLYIQAELVYLEEKLLRLEAADSASSEENRSQFSRDWYWLKHSPEDGTNEQWQIVLTIRSKLKEYYDAVAQQSAMTHLMKPEHHDLRTLQDWLERPSFGNFSLKGADSDTWGRRDRPINLSADLFTLEVTESRDAFSKWFNYKFITWFHTNFRNHSLDNGDIESGITSYSTNVMERYTSFITTIVASLLPISSTIILYCATSMKVRLGLTVLFTLIFTTCVSAFTPAKRGELFVATSTFAAVQVVFISTSNDWNKAT